MMTPAQECLHARHCPISEAPCPGECVFSDVMRSAHLGIVVLDSANKSVLFENQEASHLRQKGALASSYQAYAHLFDLDSELQDGEPRSSRLGNRTIGYSVYGVPPFCWVFFRDITDKLRLESVAEAMELTNSLGSIFSAVRHEIGNPVNSVKMALSVLRRNLHRSSPGVIEEYIDRSLSELARVEELLRSLKSFNMYEELRVEPIRLDMFLLELSEFVGRDFRSRGIGLEVDLPPHLGTVHADPRGLRQVLVNLLANATDAVEARPSPRVRIVAEAGQRVARIRIEDNGIGIAPADLAEVFKPFYTSKQHGTGLGLVIVRRMLARMHATIEIDSEEGQGTCVTVTLSREERP